MVGQMIKVFCTDCNKKYNHEGIVFLEPHIKAYDGSLLIREFICIECVLKRKLHKPTA